MRLDGSGQRLVTRGPDGVPTWTSDGRTIYFARSLPSRILYGAPCDSIFAVSVDGSGLRRVTEPSGRAASHVNPAVSPDGRGIAFSEWDACEGGTASPRLRVVDSSGRPTRDLVRLPRNGFYPNPEHSSPEWSPDGKRLAFRLNADLAVANRDGSGQRRLASGERLLIYEPPEWSPDGRWIAFKRHNAPLLVVHPDGSGRRQLKGTDDADSLAGWLPRMPG
jgi:Tol biopolymer transport system component